MSGDEVAEEVADESDDVGDVLKGGHAKCAHSQKVCVVLWLVLTDN